jgi:type IV pilus assembly protein PilN
MLINLLPHREWALARKRKNFATTLAMAALLGLLLGAGLSVWLGLQLTAQQSANSILKIEISAVDTELKKMAQVNDDLVKLNLRETTLKTLRYDGKVSSALLQEVAALLPDSLYLTALKLEGDKVGIHGVARSNEQVFEFLRLIASEGKWLTQAELIEVTGAPLSMDVLALTGMPFTMRAQLQRTRPTAKPDFVPQPSAAR